MIQSFLDQSKYQFTKNGCQYYTTMARRYPFLFDSHIKERVVDQHILEDDDSNAPLKGSLV